VTTSARILVLDENLPGRLATELEERGRRATRVSALQLKGSEDPDLLAAIAERFDDWVLVTADDRMPADHAEAIAAVNATLAIIAPARRDWPTHAWRREVVHRWAHAMHDQKSGTLRRYAVRSHALWRPRRR
jgi:PIN like domain